MATTKRCPACRSEVAADEQHCPNCPHTFFREEGVPEIRRGRVNKSYVGLVFVCALGLFAWKALNFIIKYADADDAKNNPIQELVDRANAAGGSGAAAKPADAPPAGQPDGRALDAEAEEATRRAVANGRVSIARAGAVASAAQSDAADSDDSDAESAVMVGRGAHVRPSKEWRLRGCVYDLVTLKPVGHATLVLKDVQLNRRFELVTGADGRYRTTIPSLPDRGYSVAIQAADYALSYLNPGTDGVREKPVEERREMAQDLSHAIDEPYTVQGLGDTPVETDFYLAPLHPR